MPKKRDQLMEVIEAGYMRLIADAIPDTKEDSDSGGAPMSPPVEFQHRVGLLTSATRFLAIKNKIDPDDPGGTFDDILGKLRGGKARGARGSAKTEADA